MTVVGGTVRSGPAPSRLRDNRSTRPSRQIASEGSSTSKGATATSDESSEAVFAARERNSASTPVPTAMTIAATAAQRRHDGQEDSKPAGDATFVSARRGHRAARCRARPPFRGGREPIRRRAGQCSRHDAVDAGGQPLANARQCAWGLGQPARDDRLDGRPGERRLAGDHLVEHAAQAVDVGSGVEVSLAGALLRAHVRRRAHDDAGAGETVVTAGRADRAADAEVGDQRVAVLAEQDVLRLDVAVKDTMAVGVIERPRGLVRDAEGVVQGSCRSRRIRSRRLSPAT